MRENTCAVIEAVQKGEVDEYGVPSTSDYYSQTITKYWNQKTEDFTNTINNKYMPQGYILSQNQLTAVILVAFLGVFYGIYVALFKPAPNASNTLNVDLIKNKDGVSA